MTEEEYTLEERVRDLATSVACMNIVLCRFAQIIGDTGSAQCAMDGLLAGMRAECGPEKAREVALKLAAKATGETEARLKDLFESGLSTDGIMRVIKGGGGNGLD